MDKYNLEDLELFREDLQNLEAAWARISLGASDQDRVAILQSLEIELKSCKARSMNGYQLLRSIPNYWGAARDKVDFQVGPSPTELLATGQLWPFARPETNLG